MRHRWSSASSAAAALLVAFVVVEWRVAQPMFDLSLFRLPTFAGGDIAAFGVSAGIFSVLLYLVLYLQDVLGLSALQTGVRTLILSGAILAEQRRGGAAELPGPGARADRSRAGARRRRVAAHARD